MARRKTIEELLKEAEEGKSGRTLGEQRIKELEKVPESEKEREERERKKKKRGWFSGRRDKRTVLNA
jgi:hypothetical protein